MKVEIFPSKSGGKIKAIASKSAAHRILICAAFAKGETDVICQEINEDISATVRCLTALGAKISRGEASYHVSPIEHLNREALLDCGESGSTMRFLLPVTCLLGADASFLMSGRLPSRPLSPLREELERCGITLSQAGSNPLTVRGRAVENSFRIAGNVSSQFISGLLFALAASGRCGKIEIEGRLESAPYIDLTVAALDMFGVRVEYTNGSFVINKNDGLLSCGRAEVEGDWSNAAFPLALGAMGKGAVTLTGIDINSKQGDRKILELLEAFGAKIESTEEGVTAYPSKLHGIDIDAAQIPDLVPILATLASVAKGRTVIYNAERLRIKESDRLLTACSMLTSLGASICQTEDGLVIEGVESLKGGVISSFGDHRIAMSGAVAAMAADGRVIIENAEAAAKSYPDFWRDMGSLGVSLKIE